MTSQPNQPSQPAGRQFLIALPEGSEARARHYLTLRDYGGALAHHDLPGYDLAVRYCPPLHGERGIAADWTITRARRFPCRYSYTPDGCAWVVHHMPAGRWAFGDSTPAEARLADLRCESGPTRTRIDPAAIRAGDRVTYELAGEPPFGGTVAAPRYDGAWVTEDGGGGSLDNLQRRCSFLIGWTRITGHTPAPASP